ncbi:MAG TPA: TVP38/TMEM64 family protein [Kineosporiaceae bacterium]
MRRLLRRSADPRVGVRLAALVVLIVALAVVGATIGVPDLGTVRSWIAARGPLAPVAFGAVYALAVPAPVPKSVLSTAAGLAFGIPLGALVVVAGGTAGALLAFLVGRWLGRDAVAALTRGRLRQVDDLVQRHPVAAALVVRLVPALPFTMLNYACGVTAMRARHFTLGTAIGITPGTTAFVALGSIGGQLSPWIPVSASAVLAALTLGTGVARHRTVRRRDQPGPSSPDHGRRTPPDTKGNYPTTP